jgi:hypothetical protein
MTRDIIVDAHGQFDKLVGLLSYVGYRETVALGDFLHVP